MITLTSQQLYKISAILSLLAFVLCMVLVLQYSQQRAKIIEPIQAKTYQQSQQLTQQINLMLQDTETLANELGKQWSTVNRGADLTKELKYGLNHHAHLLGIGIIYKPYAYDPDVRLYAPYFRRAQSKIKRIQLEEQIDYSLNENDWYHSRLKNGASWNEPRYSDAAEQKVVEYGRPITQYDPLTNQQEVVGIIILHLSLNEILHQITKLNMGKSGYGILLTNQTQILSNFPAAQGIETPLMSDLASQYNNKLLQQIADMTKANTNGKIDEGIDLNDNAVWGMVLQIPATQWSLAMLYNKDDMLRGDRTLRLKLTWITISLIILAASLLMMELTRSSNNTVHSLGFRALLVSSFFSLGIGMIWYLTTDDVLWKAIERTVILDHQSLEQFKKTNIKTALRDQQPLPIYIPTGVFVQSIEFTSANDVVLTGYIWQKYLDHIPETISRGFILPEAESTTVTQSYRRKKQGAEVIGWYFKAVLRQRFDYSHYPFDQQSVWIRLWHKDFDKNVILLPALDSYDQTHPEQLPGIEKDFVLPGWEVTSSFFNYHFNSYNTDFGIPQYVGKNKFPELYFQIGVKRLFLNPFISNLTPVIVVLIMLFAVLITSSKERDKVEILGFSAATILASSSALFFVVLISHIELRSSLAANNIFYMEYFYIVTYFALLAISVNSILFSWGVNAPFVQFRDNLLPKLFFWPVITFTILLITIWKFY